ncbi:carbohydrate ABC transporter permease [Virgibacillus salexigens]|uniref:carbohydrate ABC transporter permease n=1 Tax=Virgibacillus salexigens TaxID=61016 RepID=UPI001F3CCD5C|nr:carbohydrate ABC transporter permease [Virgibacillus salexigens]
MRSKKWLFSIVGFLIVAVFLFPIYWMVISSLKPMSEIFGESTLFPKNVTFEAYRNIFIGSDLAIFRHFFNSLIISFGTMIGTICLAAPAAYAIARKNLKGITLFLLFILITQMFPSNMLALPLYTMFAKIGLLNSYLGVIIANMTLSLPFVILIMRTHFLTLPKALEEAAIIDGCSRWGAFLRIILPLAKSGILTCAAFSFLLAWGEFLYSLTMLSDNSKWPITLAMRQFVGQFGTNWGELMALSAVSTLPIIIIFIFTQRHIISGIADGSTK